MKFRPFLLRSPLLGQSHLLSLPPVTKMVHFPGFASRPLLYSGADIPTLLGIPLKDWEIPRPQPVCGFLRLIAAYHVLRRLPSPRHPPCALSSLTIRFTPPEPRRESLRADSTGADLWSPFVPVSTLPGCQRSKFRPVPETKDSSKVLDFGYSLGGGKRIRTADPLLAK